MAKIPSAVLTEPIPGLELLNRGKVRDTYLLPDPRGLLVVASDRISIFDFVLNAQVSHKGAILTAMNYFWRRKVMGGQFSHDLVASGAEIDAHLPAALHGNVVLQARASVVRKLDMLPMEAIVRGCLTGTGLKAYDKEKIVCGHRLPMGLKDGDRLPCPLFTPSTKAEVGHDEHVTADSVAETFGVHPERLSLQLFALAADYAAERGIILADTKFELGRDASGALTVGDEVLTPDSSRFWDRGQWQAAQAKSPRKSPSGFDKQFVREWGNTCLKDGVPMSKLKPELDEDVDWVHAQTVPAEVLARTTQIYRYIFWRLTGKKLETYQRDEIGMSVVTPKVRVEVVSGSESDEAQMRLGCNYLDLWSKRGRVEVRRHVISCHRNPTELANFARDLPADSIVVAGAGMAAALPGVLKALLVHEGKGSVPVIGVAFKGKSVAADQAAKLSIEQLPGAPVQMKSDGTAYFGEHGFEAACRAAVEDEFLPQLPSQPKPAKLDLPLLIPESA